MRFILILLFCVSLGAGSSKHEVVNTVDIIDINSHYQLSKKHNREDEYEYKFCYDQIIFWEWSPDYRRYHVITYILVKFNSDKTGSTFELSKKGDYHFCSVVKEGNKKLVLIRAKILRHTNSCSDPRHDADQERLNKKLFDEKFRNKLYFANGEVYE